MSETVEELAGKISDMVGLYQGCQRGENGNKCDSVDTHCCRTNFMLHMEERIYSATANYKDPQVIPGDLIINNVSKEEAVYIQK